MRYILNDSGYIETVSFNGLVECNDKTCTEYTGTIPTGYENLAEWSENANINAYKIVEGNLVFDSDEDTRLQNLWTSQKTNGTGGETNTNNYSTEEQVIGTWIDGKPIYRRVIQHGLIGTTNPKTYVFTGNYKCIINENHYFLGTSGGALMLPILKKDNSLFAKVNTSISGSTGALSLELERTGGDYWPEWNLCSVVEYTKTTD